MGVLGPCDRNGATLSGHGRLTGRQTSGGREARRRHHKRAALDDHAFPRPGKLEIRPAKPMPRWTPICLALLPPGNRRSGKAKGLVDANTDPTGAARNLLKSAAGEAKGGRS